MYIVYMKTVDVAGKESLKNLANWLEEPPEGLSDLENMQFLLNQAMPGTIEMQILSLTHDEITGAAPFKPGTANLLGTMHGGTLFTLGDTLAACLLWNVFGVGKRFATTQSNIRYIRPVTEGLCTCKARIVKEYGKRVDLQADFFDDAGKRVARQLVTYILLQEG